MTRFSPLAILLVSVGLAACGGDDDDSGGAPSKAEYANQAEKICRDTEKELENIGTGAESPEEVANAIDKVIDQGRQAADDLVALERPEGEAGQTAEDFSEGFRSELNDQIVPALEDLQEALKKKDAQAVQAAAKKLQDLETSKSDAAAREIGATACVG
jgi:CHASE3 domain sensor protein